MGSRVKKIYVKKLIDDDKMEKFENTHVKPEQIKLILRNNADVYDEDTKELLLRFRKNKLTQRSIDEFYDNTIFFATNITSNRGTGSGSKTKSAGLNPKIMTNIIGFFDRMGPSQKVVFRNKGIHLKNSVRETRFNVDYPENFKKTLPLIREIDRQYEINVPDHYKKQRAKADETHFKIKGTSFTTITLNVNFKTTIHKDKGDDPDGFGNLSVIEKDGRYKGGETCLPQYGVGVDVRMGDVLFMNVHHYHGNLPIHYLDKDAKRFSIVCYLRYNIWKNTRDMSKDQALKHQKIFHYKSAKMREEERAAAKKNKTRKVRR
jgi:hypothetical protein